MKNTGWDVPIVAPRERKIRESDVEDYLVKEVAKRGGVAEKFTSPNRVSVPDRIVFWPNGRVEFVECKRLGLLPTAAQARDHMRRRAMGFTVVIVDSYETVDHYLRTRE